MMMHGSKNGLTISGLHFDDAKKRGGKWSGQRQKLKLCLLVW